VTVDAHGGTVPVLNEQLEIVDSISSQLSKIGSESLDIDKNQNRATALRQTILRKRGEETPLI
jgi:hypothetical protein